MSLGNLQQQMLHHLQFNKDGFYSTIPLEVTTTNRTFFAMNAKKASEFLNVNESTVIESIHSGETITKDGEGYASIDIDKRFLKKIKLNEKDTEKSYT